MEGPPLRRECPGKTGATWRSRPAPWSFRARDIPLDGGLEFVLFLLHHEKDLFDGRVALAKRHVGSVVDLAVLYVNVGDAVVMLLDPRRRRGSGSREKVADIDVGAVVLGIGEGLLPRPRSEERRV